MMVLWAYYVRRWTLAGDFSLSKSTSSFYSWIILLTLGSALEVFKKANLLLLKILDST
jgi:hypothetical protein